jgi:2-polyprenyl-3-methyl-5-hydroxy-6-metoxy-1,4-benzoquinol methylase
MTSEARSEVRRGVHGPYGYGDRPGGTHKVILGRVRDSVTVLDVGCNRGYLGRELHMRGCRVWGIDQDSDALEQIPADTYEDVAALDLDTVTALPWPGQQFDTIVAADVLEHLRDPGRMLDVLVSALSRQGRILVSLPNVAHASIRANLLRGHFDYQNSGILDRTHLHLFTFDSARRFIESAGLEVTATLSGSNRFGTFLNSRRRAGKRLRTLLAFNIIMEAQPVARPLSP